MMSQFPSLERIRPLLRLEVAVFVALLLAAVVWFNLNSKVEDARDEETAVEQRLRAARVDVDLFAGNNERTKLEEELQLLKLEQKTLELTPMVDAARVRDDILTYVDERKLALNAFGKQETTTPSGDREVSTLRYSFTVQGDEESLVGILSLLKEHPTASVQSLQFARLVEDPENWQMSLELAVFYLSPEQEQEQDQGT